MHHTQVNNSSVDIIMHNGVEVSANICDLFKEFMNRAWQAAATTAGRFETRDNIYSF